MAALALLTRVPRRHVKTVTFDGTTWGDIGTDTIATVTGRVLILHGSAYCSTLLAGASATIELGTENNTAGLIAQTTATDLDATEFWRDATPEVEASTAIINQLVASNILLTTATAAVTGGVIEFSFFWLPMSLDGKLD